jgi:hypothetical protein
VSENGGAQKYAIDPEKLRVFPKESDLPKDELNTTIDRHFVPVASVAPPRQGGFDAWKQALQRELRRVAFRSFPERIPPAKALGEIAAGETRLETENGIEVRLKPIRSGDAKAKVERVVLAVRSEESENEPGPWGHPVCRTGDAVYECAPRGIGATRWTQKNPPNYVERAHVLLGRTVDTGRVWDVIAAARFLHARHGASVPLYVAGEGPSGILAAYAALWEPEIAGVILRNPPQSHMDPAAPRFLNVLRVCDVEDVLGMLAPKPLTLGDVASHRWDRTAAIYATAGQSAKFVLEIR